MEGTEVVDVIHIAGNGATIGDVMPLQGGKCLYKLSVGPMRLDSSIWKSGVHAMKQRSVEINSIHFLVRR